MTIRDFTSNNEVYTVPAGVTFGTWRISKSNCTFRGTDRDSCILRSDGHAPFTVLLDFTQDVESLTIENCTLDANDLASQSGIVSNNIHCPLLVLRNVRLMGVQWTGIHIFNNADCDLFMTNCIIEGSGMGIQVASNSGITSIKDCEAWGCRSSFTVSSHGSNTVGSIKITNYKVYQHYWEVPTYESATITSIGQTYVDVASHVMANRSFADCLRLLNPIGEWNPRAGSLTIGNKWDRLETDDGRWAYILDVTNEGYRKVSKWHNAGTWRTTETPNEDVTVYSVIIGRLGDYSATRLSLGFAGIWPTPRWRTVEGETVLLPQATRLDILRHGILAAPFRDVDTGFHITSPGANSIVKGLYVEGGFSDAITIRGAGSRAEDCEVFLAQDMGITADGATGAQTYSKCKVTKAGVYGVFATGTVSFEGLSLINNGLHGEGLYGYGIHCNNGASITLDLGTCYGNRATTQGVFIKPTPSVSLKPWYNVRR